MIRWVELSSPLRTVRTLAGTGTAGFVDHSIALNAAFSHPIGVACDAGDTDWPLVLYVVDSDNHAVRMIVIQSLYSSGSAAVPVANVSTLAGFSGRPGFSDGALSTAAFRYPSHIRSARRTVWGGLLLTDSANHRVRCIPMLNATLPLGMVMTVSGNGSSGWSDGWQSTGLVRLNSPQDLTVGGAPDYVLYVTSGHAIRTVTVVVDGSVSPFVASSASALPFPANQSVTDTHSGSALVSGFVDGNSSVARFFAPIGIHCVQPTGDVYVTDSANHALRVFVNRTAQWRTVAGRSDRPGTVDGPPLLATLQAPGFVMSAPVLRAGLSAAADLGWREPTLSDNLYLSDTGNHKLRGSSALCVDTCLNGAVCNRTVTCACVSGWSRDDCSFGICDSVVCVNGKSTFWMWLCSVARDLILTPAFSFCSDPHKARCVWGTTLAAVSPVTPVRRAPLPSALRLVWLDRAIARPPTPARVRAVGAACAVKWRCAPE